VPSELHSIVVPMFNESLVAGEFHARATKALESLPDYELIIVDDGSTDDTFTIASDLAERDSHVRVVRLARNFGHQTAITAGIDLAVGDTITVIDADLQDPPELIPDMIEKWRDGADVVFAIRGSRDGESRFKKLTAKVFYRLLRRMAHTDIPLDAGDFRLMNRKAAEGLKAMRERSRYIRGLVGWMGLKRAYVSYSRESRPAGDTKYPLGKMVRLAIDGILSFSTRPLQAATLMGFFSAGLSLVYGIWVMHLRLTTSLPIEGWSSLMVVLLFFGGVQLITLGIVGEYVGRIYDEVRRRPLYLVGEVRGFSPDTQRLFDANCLPLGSHREETGQAQDGD
jgi:glycosyltransferase involved in cell wall biosynthesis